MSDHEHLDHEHTDGGTAVGPGKMVREARLKMGWSEDELGRRLKLSKHVVAAIENDDLEALPAGVFVRGYLTSFAKHLDLPSHHLLDAFDNITGNKRESVAVPANAIFRTEDQRSDQLVRRWGTALIVAIVVILLLIWLQDEIAAKFWGERKQDQSQTAQLKQPLKPQTAIEANRQASVTQIAADNTARLAAPKSLTGNSSAPDEIENSLQAPIMASAHALVLRIDADSWVEVVDATGVRLIYDLLRAGSMRSVAGEPPYDVSLGNARGVAIEFDGEPIAIERVRNDGTSRLNVGQTSDQSG